MTLKELRVEKGLTQKDVATRAGILYTTYRDMEQGYRTSLHGTAGEVLQKIAAALHVSTDELMECTERKTMYATVEQDKKSGDEWVTWFNDEKAADENSRDAYERLSDGDKKESRIYTIRVEDELFAMENGEWVFDPDGDWYDEQTEKWYFDSDVKDKFKINLLKDGFEIWIGETAEFGKVKIDTSEIDVDDYGNAMNLAEEDIWKVEEILGRDVFDKQERENLAYDILEIYEEILE